MPLLELRLEDWQVVDEAGGRAVWAPRFDPDAQPLQLEKLLLLRAALEFFDRALLAGMSGGVAFVANGDNAAFLAAQGVTLLRFGVRIVGLDGGQPRHEGEVAVERLPRGDRGLLGYGQPLQCTYGTTIEVYESSSAEGPHVWLKLRQDPRVLRGEQAGEATAHLSEEQAGAVAASLLAWLADIPERRGR